MADMKIPKVIRLKKKQNCSCEITDPSDRGYRISRGRALNCHRWARHLINGKAFCDVHGGKFLLEALEETT